MRTPNPKSVLGLTILLAVLLTACGGGGAEPTATLPPVVLPTATPTTPPPLAILLVPEGADAAVAAESVAILQAYSAETGLAYEQRSSLAAAELPANLSLLLALSPTQNLGELASAAPQARLIALGFDPGATAANLEIFALSGSSDAQAAFIAGYGAVLATDDWRVGVLYSAAEISLANAFVAGAEYFCGSCEPLSPPYQDFPLAQQSDPANWQAGADQLLSLGVRTFYLTPAMEVPELEAYLATWGASMIGAGAPAEAAAGSWMFSVGADPLAALHQGLPAHLRGQDPGEIGASLALAHVNEAFLSPARQVHMQEIIADLLAGYITLP
jgi:hypothetical protein